MARIVISASQVRLFAMEVRKVGLGDIISGLFGGGKKVKSTPPELKAEFPINEWLQETDNSGNEVMYQIGGWELDKVIITRKGTNIQLKLTKEEIQRRGLVRTE